MLVNSMLSFHTMLSTLSRISSIIGITFDLLFTSAFNLDKASFSLLGKESNLYCTIPHFRNPGKKNLEKKNVKKE